MSHLQVFKHKDFMPHEADDLFTYAFMGRQGGISKGHFSGLNCAASSGDGIDTILHNRALVARELGARQVYIAGPKQVHSAKCVRIDNPDISIDKIEADAVVTSSAQLPIGVITADCAPVLFYAYNDSQKIVGAAHAGWRGAVDGVLESTVQMMCSYDNVTPASIHACIGPCITVNSYEVDDAFRKLVVGKDSTAEKYFSASTVSNKYYFDLSGYCIHKLTKAGVGAIHNVDLDTYALKDDLFSYRRATHEGSAAQGFGRQLSAIMIK